MNFVIYLALYLIVVLLVSSTVAWGIKWKKKKMLMPEHMEAQEKDNGYSSQ